MCLATAWVSAAAPSRSKGPGTASRPRRKRSAPHAIQASRRRPHCWQVSGPACRRCRAHWNCSARRRPSASTGTTRARCSTRSAKRPTRSRPRSTRATRAKSRRRPATCCLRWLTSRAMSAPIRKHHCATPTPSSNAASPILNARWRPEAWRWATPRSRTWTRCGTRPNARRRRNNIRRLPQASTQVQAWRELNAGLGDELGVEVAFHRLGAALGSVTGILDAAERHLRQRKPEAVDRNHAAFDRGADRCRRLGRACEGVGRKAERQPVGFGRDLVEGRERRDQRERSKRLFVHGARILRHIGYDRRLEEVALVADAVTAGGDGGALGLGVLHHLLDGADATRIGQRTHLAILVHAVADLDGLGTGGELFDELVIDALLHQETRRRNADLAGIAVLRSTEDLGRRCDVRIVEHDRRRMTAQFHGHPLHVLAGQRGELLADIGRTGEGNLPDDRVRNEVLRNLRGNTIDQIDHTGRNTGIDKGADQFGRRCRGLFRRLDDDRATGSQRRGQLAHHLVDREIPRRERGNRADRLLDRHLVDTGQPGRDDATVRTAAFLGEPFDDVGRRHRLHLGFDQRLALLLDHQRSDGVGALAHQRSRLLHHLGAVERRHRAPLLEAAVGGGKRFVEVRLVGMSDGPDRLLGRGVKHRNGLARGAPAPFSVDMQQYIGIRHRRSPWRDWGDDGHEIAV